MAIRLHSGRMGIDIGDVPVKWVAINATLLGDNTLVAAVPRKKVRVLTMVFRSETSSLSQPTIQIKSGNNIKIQETILAANEELFWNAVPHGFVVETNIGEPLILNQSILATSNGWLNYIEV